MMGSRSRSSYGTTKDPRYDRCLKAYLAGRSLTQIAAEFKIGRKQLIRWRREHSWNAQLEQQPTVPDESSVNQILWQRFFDSLYDPSIRPKTWKELESLSARLLKGKPALPEPFCSKHQRPLTCICCEAEADADTDDEEFYNNAHIVLGLSKEEVQRLMNRPEPQHPPGFNEVEADAKEVVNDGTEVGPQTEVVNKKAWWN